MQHRPARTTVACLVVLALLLAACEATERGGQPSTPAPGGTVPAAEPAEPISGGALRFGLVEPAIVPFDATDADSLVVIDTLFDSLTSWTSTLTVAAAAATNWETPDEGRTWIFHLREGATFHDEDATPVTAADFAFAWDLAVAHGSAGWHLRGVAGYEALRRGEASTLSGVTAPDRYTLRVRLSEPYGAFPWVVAHPALGPVPQHLWERDPAAFQRHPVGNGPFMAAEALVPGQFLRVQRFDGWRNGPEPALLDEVLFQFMDPDTAFLAFQQERLQVSPLPAAAVDLAVRRYGRTGEGDRGPGVIDAPTPSVYFLAFDVGTPPFDRPEVRRAISLAIDREAIATTALGGNVAPAAALVAPEVSGADGSCEVCRHDPAEAAAIFAEHGVESIALWFNGDGGHRPVAEQVRRDLLDAGVSRVVFRAPDFTQFLDTLEAGEAGFFRYGWQPEYPLADDVLYPLFHSSRVPARPDPEPDDAGDGSGEPADGAVEAVPGEDVPAEDVPGENVPGEDVPGEDVPGEDVPGEDADAPSPAAPGVPGDDRQTEVPATGPPEASDAGDGAPEEGARGNPGSGPDGRNYMGYADAEVDALLEDARATTSTIRRRYLHGRVEDIVVNRDVAVVPLFFYRQQRVVDNRVAGFRVNAMGLVDLHRVQLRRDPDAGPTMPAGD